MAVLIVSQNEVPKFLPMDECIEAVEQALTTLTRGDAILPLRPVMALPGDGVLALMPAYLGDLRSMGVKVISVFPGNLGTQYDAHQGAVMLFEAEQGCLRAIVDATAITAIRTAATSAVATKLLARADASDLAIVGSGTQASSHLEAMLAVRKIRRVRVWSRTPTRAHQFAARETVRHGITVEAVGNAREAVENADLICTTTSASDPVVFGDWIAPGAHINAVGACRAGVRELDTAAVVRSRLFVDRRESTMHEAGDFLLPKKEGVIGDDHIRGEIGELMLGLIEGRTADDQITLFKSLGMAIEDLASVHHIFEKAKAQRLGTWVEMGGRRVASEE